MGKLSKPVIVVMCLCILLIVITLLFRFVFVSDERRIEIVLKNAIEAVRNEDVDGCMEYVAITEWDSTTVTRAQMRELLEGGFAKFDKIRILYDDFNASVNGRLASATVRVKVLAKYDDQTLLLLGTLTEGKELTLGFVKEGKKWYIYSVTGVELPDEVFDEL